MTTVAGQGPVAYLTGEYPKVSHTFIQREIAALRALGLTVHTCTVRRAAPRDVLSDQTAEAAATFSILGAARNPLTLLAAHAAILRHHPRRWFSTLRLALTTGSPGLRAFLYQLFYFAESAVLARHLTGLGVRHLHNHFSSSSCTVAMLTSSLSGIPYSFTMHGPDIFFEPMRWRIDVKIARAAFVACISDFCRSQAMLFSDRAHWDRLHIIHCGIDPALYDAPPAPPGQHIVFVGRLAAVKGVPVLFDALTRLAATHPALRLTLIGDGPERATLMAEARAMGLDPIVTFAGYQTTAEVAAHLKTAHLLVLPSFAEGVPVVLMEAMATRLPVIASRIAGIPELIDHGVSGLLTPPGDADALARAIADILSDPVRARAMGDAGRARVTADFATMTEAARLATLFHAALTGGPRPARRPDTITPPRATA